MSPTAEALFLEKIYPTIVKTVPRAVTPVGPEDVEELVQDAAVSAIQGIESLESRGEPIYPSSVAYYAIQRTKSGRRSQSASRRCLLSPGTILDGDAPLLYFDDAADASEGDDAMGLYEAVADRKDDPATRAMRRLDWSGFWPKLTPTEQYVVTSTATGEKGIDQAAHLGMTPAGIVYIKRGVAKKARAYWGQGLLRDLSQSPLWQRELAGR